MSIRRCTGCAICRSKTWVSPKSTITARCARECRRSDRKSTRLNSSHLVISYAVFCLKKKNDQSSYHVKIHRIVVNDQDPRRVSHRPRSHDRLKQGHPHPRQQRSVSGRTFSLRVSSLL